MKPYGPLMIEHRLIERMVNVLKNEADKISKTGKADSNFIDSAIDFFRIYADKRHHGKEEDILFRGLAKKQISDEHKKIMESLIEDHITARKTVTKLSESKEKYASGDKGAINSILECIKALTKLYLPHIKKEDTQFFIPCMNYFSQQEQAEMLKQFEEIDRQISHEKYKTLIEQLEKQSQPQRF